MIHRLEDGVGHGHYGPFLAAAGCQAMVPGVVERAFCPRRRPCRLAQDGFGLLVPVGGASVFFLPALSLLPGETPTQLLR
jgi:hypothetical protein